MRERALIVKCRFELRNARRRPAKLRLKPPSKNAWWAADLRY
jgi:hypothetical protein